MDYSALLLFAFFVLCIVDVFVILKSKRIRKWLKVLLSTPFIILGCIMALLLVLALSLYSSRHLTKKPQAARSYLEDIGINIIFPDFSVNSHTFSYVGGDDMEERWEIKYTQPITGSFITTLDSLCQNDSRWRRETDNIGFEMTDDMIECYVFTVYTPDSERVDKVIIKPNNNEATLIHLKI